MTEELTYSLSIFEALTDIELHTPLKTDGYNRILQYH